MKSHINGAFWKLFSIVSINAIFIGVMLYPQSLGLFDLRSNIINSGSGIVLPAPKTADLSEVIYEADFSSEEWYLIPASGSQDIILGENILEDYAVGLVNNLPYYSPAGILEVFIRNNPPFGYSSCSAYIGFSLPVYDVNLYKIDGGFLRELKLYSFGEGGEVIAKSDYGDFICSSGWNYIPCDLSAQSCWLQPHEETDVTFSSLEGDYPLEVRIVIPKFYHGAGKMYAQHDGSDPVEDNLKMRSPELTPLILYPSDTIEVEFQTTATDGVFLDFLQDNTIIRTFEIVPVGNTNFETQTMTISIPLASTSFAFDQIQFSGNLRDKKYIQINSFSIIRERELPTFSSVEEPSEVLFGENNPPEVICIPTDNNGIDSVSMRITGFATYPLIRSTETGYEDHYYFTLTMSGGRWHEWYQFWDDLPLGEYELDICAFDLAQNEGHFVTHVNKITPAVTIVSPNFNPVFNPEDPGAYYSDLSHRIFGSEDAPGVTRGVPPIYVSISDPDSHTESVIASIWQGGAEPLGAFDMTPVTMPSGYQYYAISSDPFGGDHVEWAQFWADTSAHGEGEYLLTVSVEETTVSVPLYRDLSNPTLDIKDILNGTAFAWDPNWDVDDTGAIYPIITLNVNDPAIGILADDFPWCAHELVYTFDPVDNPSAGIDWIPVGNQPFEVPTGDFQVILDGDFDGDGFTDWQALPEGPVTVTFGVVDCGGWVTTGCVTIIKDISPPINILYLPEFDAECTEDVSSVSYQLSINENYLATIEYSLGAGNETWHVIPWDKSDQTVGTVTTTFLQGVFDAGTWAWVMATTPEVDGFVVRFRSTDLAGQQDITSRSINIDSIAPRMKLKYPISGEAATSEAPALFFESVRDLHLQSIYYTVGESPTKYFIELPTNTGDTIEDQIQQSAWDLALAPSVTIKFYAEDSYGHVSVIAVTLTRTDYIGPGNDETPGFHNFFNAGWQEWAVMGVVAAVTVIVLAAFHRGEEKQVPKVPQEALLRADRRL